MRQINIFIAGSTEHKYERSKIRSATTLLHLPNDVKIEIKSCENLGNDQSKYNEYIRNLSDIVIFIITNKIGAITEAEFLLAAHCYRKHMKPEILIFRETPPDKKSFELGMLEGLIKGALYDIEKKAGKYYTMYINDDDLESKAASDIENLILNKILNKSNSNYRYYSDSEKLDIILERLMKHSNINEEMNDYIS